MNIGNLDASCNHYTAADSGWVFLRRSHSQRHLFPPSWRFGSFPRWAGKNYRDIGRINMITFTMVIIIIIIQLGYRDSKQSWRRQQNTRQYGQLAAETYCDVMTWHQNTQYTKYSLPEQVITSKKTFFEVFLNSIFFSTPSHKSMISIQGNTDNWQQKLTVIWCNGVRSQFTMLP